MPAGLNNLGNTCYMNATLQCLRSVSELRDAIKKFDLLSALLVHAVCAPVCHCFHKKQVVCAIACSRLSCLSSKVAGTPMGGLGSLATWQLPGGPVGSPARLAAMSNVEVGQMRRIVGHFIFR